MDEVNIITVDQAAPCFWHASTRARNLVRQTANHWPRHWGLDRFATKLMGPELVALLSQCNIGAATHRNVWPVMAE
jgi:hypothetical protein